MWDTLYIRDDEKRQIERHSRMTPSANPDPQQGPQTRRVYAPPTIAVSRAHAAIAGGTGPTKEPVVEPGAPDMMA
jgi:hypothetical protein